MASIAQKDVNALVSTCNVSALDAAHFKALFDAMDAAQSLTPTFRLANFLRQLQANSVIGERDAEYLLAAIPFPATGTPLTPSGDTAAAVRAALRKLNAVLPQSVVEDLVALVFT